MRGRPAIRAKRATTIDDGRAGRPLCGSREPFRHSRSCAHPPLLTLLVSRLRTGISVACWSERRPLGSNAENLTEESMTSERVLRLASIVAFALALFPLPLVSIDTSTAAVFRRRSVRA